MEPLKNFFDGFSVKIPLSPDDPASLEKRVANIFNSDPFPHSSAACSILYVLRSKFPPLKKDLYFLSENPEILRAFIEVVTAQFRKAKAKKHLETAASLSFELSSKYKEEDKLMLAATIGVKFARAYSLETNRPFNKRGIDAKNLEELSVIKGLNYITISEKNPSANRSHLNREGIRYRVILRSKNEAEEFLDAYLEKLERQDLFVALQQTATLEKKRMASLACLQRDEFPPTAGDMLKLQDEPQDLAKVIVKHMSNFRNEESLKHLREALELCSQIRTISRQDKSNLSSRISGRISAKINIAIKNEEVNPPSQPFKSGLPPLKADVLFYYPHHSEELVDLISLKMRNCKHSKNLLQQAITECSKLNPKLNYPERNQIEKSLSTKLYLVRTADESEFSKNRQCIEVSKYSPLAKLDFVEVNGITSKVVIRSDQESQELGKELHQYVEAVEQLEKLEKKEVREEEEGVDNISSKLEIAHMFESDYHLSQASQVPPQPAAIDTVEEMKRLQQDKQAALENKRRLEEELEILKNELKSGSFEIGNSQNSTYSYPSGSNIVSEFADNNGKFQSSQSAHLTPVSIRQFPPSNEDMFHFTDGHLDELITLIDQQTQKYKNEKAQKFLREARILCSQFKSNFSEKEIRNLSGAISSKLKIAHMFESKNQPSQAYEAPRQPSPEASQLTPSQLRRELDEYIKTVEDMHHLEEEVKRLRHLKQETIEI